jgi:Tfp pilus assembly protein PilO
VIEVKLPKLKPKPQSLGLLQRLDAILPGPLKGKGRLPIMALSFFLVAAVIAAVNWRLHTIRVDVQRQAESQERAVARIPEIRQNINKELEDAERLAGNRNTVYAMLPGLTNVPVIVHQLEELGRKAGGETTQVEYAPLQQRTSRIEVQFRVQFSGDYGDCLRYMYNIVASFPTIAIRQVVLERPAEESGFLSLNLELVLSALESRASDLPSWDFGRMVAFPVTPLGHPFDAPAQVEKDTPKAVSELSGWTLKGIMNNGGEKRALFEVNGRTQWLTVGDEIGGAELVKVAEGVAHLWSAGRIFTFRLQGR